jgi:hypothetical protein
VPGSTEGRFLDDGDRRRAGAVIAGVMNMTTLVVVGVVLEVSGIGAVMWGADTLAAELFPQRPLPITRARRWLRRTFGKTQTVTGTASGALGNFTATATGVAHPPTVTTAHTIEQQIAALSVRIDTVSEEVRKERQARADAVRQLQGEISAERERREAGLAGLDTKVRSWIGGAEGSGLQVAFWGAAATLAGAVCQGVASIATS